MSGFGGLIGGIGGAVGDMFTAEADTIEAKGDWDAAARDINAANIEDQNINLEKLSNNIQLAQATRKIAQTEGTGVAIEGAGNVSGGSAGDIMRENIQQGALAKTMINTQSAIKENADLAQEDAYKGEAEQLRAKSNALDKQAQGAQVAGIFSILGGVAGMM
jgi:hypothetical protein